MSEVSAVIRDLFPAGPQSGASPLASDLEAEVEAIRSVLSIRGRFVLASVLCDDPALERAAINDLRRSSPEVCIVEMSPHGDSDPFSLAANVAPAQPGAVFVTGLTGWLSDPVHRSARADALNASRERWIDRFRCPVLLWMNHTTAHALAQHAPDLWRYRSHRFELERDRDPASTMLAGGHYEGSGPQPLAETERDARERIQELQQRLCALPPDASPSLLELSNRWRNEMGLLQMRLGELDAAERTFQEALAVKRKETAADEGRAILLGNLAEIAWTRGDLTTAERLLNEALDIARQLGWLGSQATRLGNLGVIAKARGDLDAAERLHRESLEIARRIGRPEGQASNIGNLGLIAWTRGDLDAAERLLTESLEFYRRLGSFEGQAKTLGNLGGIAEARGDLDAAERLYRSALEIERRLGQVEGQAIALGNLGGIAKARGDLNAAERLSRESLAIDQRIGRPTGQAIQLGNLGVIARARGDLDAAERLHRESLEIARRLGMPEEQASNIGNLGLIAQSRGDVAEARRLWAESRDLFARAGMPHRVKQLQAWLDELPLE